MSRKPAPEWIARRGCSQFGLSAVQRAVLLCLWDHANSDRVSWPSAPTIARETGYSDRAVKGAFVALSDRGFIIRMGVERYESSGQWSRHAVRWSLTESPRLVIAA